MIINIIETFEIVIFALMLLSSFVPLYKYFIYKKQKSNEHVVAYNYASLRGFVFLVIMIPLYLADVHIAAIAVIYSLLYFYNYSLTRRSLRAHHYYLEHDNETIHIFNGDATYLHFKDQFIGRRKIVFDEALALGDIKGEFLSHEFIEKRIKYLSKINHDEDIHVKYENFVHSMCELSKVDTYSYVELYFDEDMFCQINMLAILHYLYKNKYTGSIRIHYLPLHVTDSNIEHQITSSIAIDQHELTYLSELYEKVSNLEISVVSEEEDGDKLGILYKGINLYLDFKHNSEVMKQKVRDTYLKFGKNKKRTIEKLLKENVEYGLPDLYYERVINKIE